MMLRHAEEVAKSEAGTSQSNSSRRVPGSKPDFRKLRDHDLAPSSRYGGTQNNLHGFNLDEDDEDDDEGWSDSDWEAEERAAPVPGGDPMDGPDVGCPPTRKLRLPQACEGATATTIQLGVCGRSILNVPWEIPVAAKRSHKGRARGKLPTPPWRKHVAATKNQWC